MRFIKSYKLFENSDQESKLPIESDVEYLIQEILDLGMHIRQIKYGYTIPEFTKDDNYKLEPIKLTCSNTHNTYRCICVVDTGQSGMSSKTLTSVISEFEFCKSKIEDLYDVTCELIIMSTRGVLVIITAK